jgi:MYXO-CTERM domain-containing protein
MKRSTFTTCARTSVFALSVLLLPLSTPTFAQTATPTPETRSVDTRADRDRTGLWGLLGLAGLFGLMGRRRPDTVHTYTDARERSRT